MIGLVGYYGYGNYGDEVFLRIWRETLGFTNTVFAHPFDNFHLIDKIVVGGGDLVWNYDLNNNYFLPKEVIGNRKTYYYGLGVPLPTKLDTEERVKQGYIDYFNRAEYVSVRDEGSFNWIKEHLGIGKVQLVEDMAWGFTSLVRVPKKEKVVGLTIRRNQVMNLENCVQLCIKLIDKGYSIRLLPLQNSYHNTRNMHLSLMEDVMRSVNYPDITITPENIDIEHLYAEIRSLDHYITMAFHGAVASFKEKVPTLMVTRGNKLVQLAKKLKLSKAICGEASQINEKLDFLFSKDYVIDTSIVKKIEEKSKNDLACFVNEVLLK